MSNSNPLIEVFHKLTSLENQKKTREYASTRKVLISLLQDDKPDEPEDLKSIIKGAIKFRDGEIVFAALQSAYKHKTPIKPKYINKLFEQDVYTWLSPYLFQDKNLEEYLSKLRLRIFPGNDKESLDEDGTSSTSDRSRAASSTLPPRPSGKAPTPHKTIPLTVMFKRLEELHNSNTPDQSVYNNYRKALILLLKDEVPDSQEDLGQIFKLAKDTKDYEIIDAIITPFIYKPIKNGKLLNNIIETYVELEEQPWFVTFFVHKPYHRKLEQLLGTAFDSGTASLTNEQLEKLLKLALKQNDFKLVAKLLAAPPSDPEKNIDDDKKDTNTEDRTKIAFRLLRDKIKDCYANYTKDNKKSLFWLVSIKEIIENDELLDLKGLNEKEVIELANLSLDYNNIQFAETWVKACPKTLEDKTFKPRIIAKYKDALKDVLRDKYSRNGFGISTILAILDSKVLENENLKKLFKNNKELSEILANLDITWRNIIIDKLRAKGALEDLDHASLTEKDSEQRTIQEIFQKGDVGAYNSRVETLDLTKKYDGKSLLHYAVSYDWGDKWAINLLKQHRDVQEKDKTFKKLRENKRVILEKLLESKKFSKEDIQEAFNTVYEEGSVSSKDDSTVLTAYANRGDEPMARMLFQAGANPDVGRTFVSVRKALVYSQVASTGLDVVLGVGTNVAQHYTKIPFNNWYKKAAAWISGGTGALTFMATGAVVEAYNRNLNPEYFKNNFIDLTGVVIAGTYKINWYGKVETGENLEAEVVTNSGYTGVENAISSENDITPNNINLHHDVAQKIYNDYIDLREKERHIRFKVVKDVDRFKVQLEEMNKKCQYGIPGDDGYSFNREFQAELEDLFSVKKLEQTIESIVSTKANQSFFLDLARGVEQGLIKTTLELKRRIIEARDSRKEEKKSEDKVKGVWQKILERVHAKPNSASVEGVIQKKVSPVFGPVTPDVPFKFAKLRKLYDAHSEDSIPFSVLLMAQFYKQLGISRTDRIKSFSEKSWDSFVFLWQGLVGKASQVFGVTNEEGNKAVTEFLKATGSVMTFYLGWYEQKLRDEIAQNGMLKSACYICTICSSAMISIEYAGIPPLVVFPVIGTILGGLLCRHFKINPFVDSGKLLHKVYDSVLPTPDPMGIFINKSTRKQFEALYQNMRSSLIPEVAGMAI